jgi:IS4 transposase
MAEVVRRYARRWDIELVFKTVKTDLGLEVLWSSKWPVIRAMLIIAQLAAHLRFLVAQAAKVDLFDVSRREASPSWWSRGTTRSPCCRR